MHEEFIAFIEASPTPWHAVEEIAKHLDDFTELRESDSWQLEPGKGYFVRRGGAAIAFRMPKGAPERALILASHTDSPALRIKPQPALRDQTMNLYRVEVYGGPTLSTWFDRDLAIAGRLVTDKGTQLIHDKTGVTIPSLAIHLQTDAERKAFAIDKQKHLSPLISLSDKETKPFADALAFDLYLVPMEPPRRLASDLLAAYRIDNLSSAYVSLKALKEAKANDTLQIALFCNHEEIGSGTDEGAEAPLLTDTLQRIASGEAFFRLKANSLCLSLDVSHAYHPNFADKYDAGHRPLLGGGPILKHNASQRYMTSAETIAPIVKLCREKKIPYQEYAGNNELRCGSTVGPIIASKGISTLDIGIPQLAMHSARELMQLGDLKALHTLLQNLLV